MTKRKRRKIHKRQMQIMAELEALLPVLKTDSFPTYYYDKFIALKSEAAGLQFELDNRQ